MSTQENKALVQRFFDEICNGRKLDVADELFAADHHYQDPSLPGVPPGPAGMKQVVGVYQTSFPDVFWRVDDMLAADDQVEAVRAQVDGRDGRVSVGLTAHQGSSCKSASQRSRARLAARGEAEPQSSLAPELAGYSGWAARHCSRDSIGIT